MVQKLEQKPLHGESYIYITDKNGKKLWNTSVSTRYAFSERKNLEQHLKNAEKHPQLYKFLDLPTAKIVQIDGESLPEMTDEELLKELGL